MSAEFVRVDRTTIADYVKGEEINILKNQKVTALLHQKGRVTFDGEGNKWNWKVRKSRGSLQPYGDTDLLTFPRRNRDEEATLPVRGYVLSEGVSEKEKAMNKGAAQIIDIVAQLVEAMLDDAKYGFAAEFFKDGNAAGNEDRIHGFPSWLGVTGNNQYTAPSDTYAGLSTVLGNYGGAVLSGSWPTGSFDPEYYFWSPLIVNYTHADWAASTDNWANNALEALRGGFIHSQNQKGVQGQMDLVLMTASMYEDFLGSLDEKERIQVERDGEKSALVSLGFKNVVNYDGVDLSYDSDVPETQAYGLNFDELELRSWNDQLWVPNESFDHNRLADQYSLHFFGNLKGNPRASVLWDDIT